MSYLLSCIPKADFSAPLKDATVGPRGFPHYAYPAECDRAPVLPGVLLLFSDDVLIHVSSAGNLRDALSTKGPRHRRTTHFACEVIFDHRYRTARATELAQFLTPRS